MRVENYFEQMHMGKEEIDHLRYPLIGFVGSLASGKSTLSGIIEYVWSVTGYQIDRFEENFPDNPYLELFYEDPSQHSYDSQVFFLRSKVEQMTAIRQLLEEKSIIIDPALDMDFIFALAQYKMGWMSDTQFDDYRKEYFESIEELNLPKPDFTVIVTASPETIRDRVRRRNRSFELGVLDNNPEYFDILCNLVNSYYSNYCGKGRVRVDSDITNFISSPRGLITGVEEVGNFLRYYQERDGLPKEGLILPSFL